MDLLSSFAGSLLEESINDKYIFKAVFLAGGPGSGKSFVAEKVYGGTGARLINSDELLEFLFKKNELSLVIAKEGTPEYERQMAERSKAKKLVKIKQKNYINGMLPVVIDGTGKDFDKIKKQALEMKEHGYDVGMVFVNTSLEVAKARNQKRARTVPEKIVVDSWRAVQENMGKFQQFFGPNFFIVDNSNTLDDAGIRKLNSDMAKIAFKLIKAPLKNKIGLEIIDRLKEKGGKYMTDLLEEDLIDNGEEVLEESKDLISLEGIVEKVKAKYAKDKHVKVSGNDSNLSVSVTVPDPKDYGYMTLKVIEQRDGNLTVTGNWTISDGDPTKRGGAMIKSSGKIKRNFPNKDRDGSIGKVSEKLFMKFITSEIDSMLEEEIDNEESILEESKYLDLSSSGELLFMVNGKKVDEKTYKKSTEVFDSSKTMFKGDLTKLVHAWSGKNLSKNTGDRMALAGAINGVLTKRKSREAVTDEDAIKLVKTGKKLLEESMKKKSVLEEQTNYYLDDLLLEESRDYFGLYGDVSSRVLKTVDKAIMKMYGNRDLLDAYYKLDVTFTTEKTAVYKEIEKQVGDMSGFQETFAVFYRDKSLDDNNWKRLKAVISKAFGNKTLAIDIHKGDTLVIMRKA